jgi:gas vesicle protein
MGKKKHLLNFDNHISIGHVVTTIGILVAGITWYANTENRLVGLEQKYADILSIIEQQNESFNEKIRDQKNDIKDDIKDIKDSLKSIEGKIDNKADKL